mmetsp:Transcript_40971/g.85300  ORF Transcript_40971/g.85300 Transcript_40971/m.85300 type:complete len:323 (-) Transcript_40971:468-1436(-)
MIHLLHRGSQTFFPLVQKRPYNMTHHPAGPCPCLKEVAAENRHNYFGMSGRPMVSQIRVEADSERGTYWRDPCSRDAVGCSELEWCFLRSVVAVVHLVVGVRCCCYHPILLRQGLPPGCTFLHLAVAYLGALHNPEEGGHKDLLAIVVDGPSHHHRDEGHQEARLDPFHPSFLEVLHCHPRHWEEDRVHIHSNAHLVQEALDVPERSGLVRRLEEVLRLHTCQGHRTYRQDEDRQDEDLQHEEVAVHVDCRTDRRGRVAFQVLLPFHRVQADLPVLLPCPCSQGTFDWDVVAEVWMGSRHRQVPDCCSHFRLLFDALTYGRH